MELKPGAKLGHYKLVTAIGKGGMGEVWKARDACGWMRCCDQDFGAAFINCTEQLSRQ
jgi:hypothetical protein